MRGSPTVGDKTPTVSAPVLSRPGAASLLSRFSFGHAVMIVAGLLAFVLVAAVLRGEARSVAIAVAAHDIRAGEAIRAGDVRARRVGADSGLSPLFARPGDFTTPIVAGRSFTAGAPIPRDDLRPAAAGGQLRAMSVPVGVEHAAGGDLGPGDRVDVIDVEGSRADYVVRGAEVLGVAPRGRGGTLGLSSGTGEYYVTLALDADAALHVAVALRQGKVEVLRSTGAAPLVHTTYDAGAPASSG